MEDIQLMNKEMQLSDKDDLSLLSVRIQKNKEYQYGLDIIRFIAMYFVIGFHATGFNKFKKNKIDNIILFLCGMHRYLTSTCDPLFMTLTGYLFRQKKPVSSYFSKLIGLIIEYMLCSFIDLIFSIKYLKIEYTNESIINYFFRFGTPYSWYINMYIGLFLLAPYLNMLFNCFKSVKEKFVFVIITVIIFSLPNSYLRCGWNYWGGSYPIMYYFIGSLIRDYQPKMNKMIIIIFIIVMDILQTLCRIYSKLIIVENVSNVGCVIISTLIFLLFYDLKAKNKNCVLKVFRDITDTSLSCFLLSYLFEEIFRKEIYIKKDLKTFMQRLPYLLYTTNIIFLGGVICGLFAHNIAKLITKSIFYFFSKVKECIKNENLQNNEGIN